MLIVNGGPVAPSDTSARNWGFDVTPAHLVDTYVTEDGVFDADGVAAYLATPDR